MRIRSVESHDGLNLYYEVEGEGPPLILLHGGLVHNRSSWRESGYVERLSREFRVISIDLRGHGESDKPLDAQAYTADRMVGDIHSVADACGASRFGLWGFSLGGSLVLQAAANSKRVARAIVGGSCFGRVQSEDDIETIAALVEPAAIAQEQGRLAEMTMSYEQRSFAEQFDLRAVLALQRGLALWPEVSPSELRCPSFVYAGTEDHLSYEKLKTRSVEIEEAGVALVFFEGLGHMGLFTQADKVLPPARAFLRGGIPSLSR